MKITFVNKNLINGCANKISDMEMENHWFLI